MHELTLENGGERNPAQPLSKIQTVLLITTLSGLGVVNSMSNGLLTVDLPVLVVDLRLASHLLLWFVTSYILCQVN